MQPAGNIRAFSGLAFPLAAVAAPVHGYRVVGRLTIAAVQVDRAVPIGGVEPLDAVFLTEWETFNLACAPVAPKPAVVRAVLYTALATPGCRLSPRPHIDCCRSAGA